MAIKTYQITFSHLLRVKDGKPQFIISACTIVALTRFGASVNFYKYHNSKTNKVLFIVEVK